jgi:hypothetical protein
VGVLVGGRCAGWVVPCRLAVLKASVKWRGFGIPILEGSTQLARNIYLLRQARQWAEPRASSEKLPRAVFIGAASHFAATSAFELKTLTRSRLRWRVRFRSLLLVPSPSFLLWSLSETKSSRPTPRLLCFYFVVMFLFFVKVLFLLLHFASCAFWFASLVPPRALKWQHEFAAAQIETLYLLVCVVFFFVLCLFFVVVLRFLCLVFRFLCRLEPSKGSTNAQPRPKLICVYVFLFFFVVICVFFFVQFCFLCLVIRFFCAASRSEMAK